MIANLGRRGVQSCRDGVQYRHAPASRPGRYQADLDQDAATRARGRSGVGFGVVTARAAATRRATMGLGTPSRWTMPNSIDAARPWSDLHVTPKDRGGCHPDGITV